MTATFFTELFASCCYPPRMLERKPRPKARIILEVELGDLDFVDQEDDFPLVMFDGEYVEVCDESMTLVGDEFNDRSAGR